MDNNEHFNFDSSDFKDRPKEPGICFFCNMPDGFRGSGLCKTHFTEYIQRSGRFIEGFHQSSTEPIKYKGTPAWQDALDHVKDIPIADRDYTEQLISEESFKKKFPNIYNTIKQF